MATSSAGLFFAVEILKNYNTDGPIFEKKVK